MPSPRSQDGKRALDQQLKDNPRSDRWTVGFGLERIALVAHRHPLIATAIMALIAVVSIYGLFHVTIDRDLRDMFQGQSEAYRTYQAASAAFADEENQILLLIESPTLGTPETFSRLRDLHLELQLLEDVASVFSVFSLLNPPEGDQRPRPLISDPSAGLSPELIAAIRAHPILGQTVLSADGTTALIAVTHAKPRAPLAEQELLLAEIEEIVPEVMAGSDYRATLTGLTALRAEIVRLLKRDQIVLNGAGILVGFILSFIFFRSWVGSLLTALPSAFAGLTLIGWNGALGVSVTMVSNVVPVLVIVLGYADGMHLTSAWRRHRDRGLSVNEAERMALIESAPPCMLTALTMAVAFLSMTISDVKMVREFGFIGAVGCIVGTWIVLVGHVLVVRALGRFWHQSSTTARTPLGWLAAPTAGVTAWVVKRGWWFAIASIPLTVFFGFLFLSVPPDHSVRETLPASSPGVVALGIVDEQLGGAFRVEVIIPMAEEEATTPEGLTRIRAVHEAMVTVDGAQAVLSMWSLGAWLGAETDADLARISELVADLPDDLRLRFAGSLGALVSMNIHELSTQEQIALVDRVEAAAYAVDPTAIVTGATVLSAREATRTINHLNTSLGLAIFVGLALIAVALRSVIIGLVALIPNLLPDMATGSLLYFLGDGMQITSVVALTIAFGIAIDDTIHYLSVVFRHRSGSVNERLVAAAREVGPVLIATTLIIVAGMAMTLTSGLTTVMLFGAIVVTALLMALIGDLVFLPAIMSGPARRWFTRQPADAIPGHSAANDGEATVRQEPAPTKAH